MQFRIRYRRLKIIDGVILPQKVKVRGRLCKINGVLFGKALGVPRSTGFRMLKTGNVHARYWPRLREIDVRDLVKERT